VDDVAVYVARSLRIEPLDAVRPPEPSTPATQLDSGDAVAEARPTAPKAATAEPYGAGGERSVDEPGTT